MCGAVGLNGLIEMRASSGRQALFVTLFSDSCLDQDSGDLFLRNLPLPADENGHCLFVRGSPQRDRWGRPAGRLVVHCSAAMGPPPCWLVSQRIASVRSVSDEVLPPGLPAGPGLPSAAAMC